MRIRTIAAFFLCLGCSPLEDGDPPLTQRAVAFWLNEERWESNLVVYAKKFPNRMEIFAERTNLSHIKLDLKEWLPGNYLLDTVNILSYKPPGMQAIQTDSQSTGSYRILRYEEKPARIQGTFSAKLTNSSGQTSELKDGTFNLTFVTQ